MKMNKDMKDTTLGENLGEKKYTILISVNGGNSNIEVSILSIKSYTIYPIKNKK